MKIFKLSSDAANKRAEFGEMFQQFGTPVSTFRRNTEPPDQQFLDLHTPRPRKVFRRIFMGKNTGCAHKGFPLAGSVEGLPTIALQSPRTKTTPKSPDVATQGTTAVNPNDPLSILKNVARGTGRRGRPRDPNKPRVKTTIEKFLEGIGSLGRLTGPSSLYSGLKNLGNCSGNLVVVNTGDNIPKVLCHRHASEALATNLQLERTKRQFSPISSIAGDSRDYLTGPGVAEGDTKAIEQNMRATQQAGILNRAINLVSDISRNTLNQHRELGDALPPSLERIPSKDELLSSADSEELQNFNKDYTEKYKSLLQQYGLHRYLNLDTIASPFIQSTLSGSSEAQRVLAQERAISNARSKQKEDFGVLSQVYTGQKNTEGPDFKTRLNNFLQREPVMKERLSKVLPRTSYGDVYQSTMELPDEDTFLGIGSKLQQSLKTRDFEEAHKGFIDEGSQRLSEIIPSSIDIQNAQNDERQQSRQNILNLIDQQRASLGLRPIQRR